MAGVSTFNELLVQFIDELAQTFPENTIVITYKKTVTSLMKKDPGLCLDTYMKNVRPHEELIRNRDERIFEELSKNYGILKSLDLNSLWKSELSEKSRQAIWEYVQCLYVIGNNVDPQELVVSRKTNMDFSPEIINSLMGDVGDDGNPMAEVMKNLSNPEFMNKINKGIEEQFGDGQGGIDESKIMKMMGPLMGNISKMFENFDKQ